MMRRVLASAAAPPPPADVPERVVRRLPALTPAEAAAAARRRQAARAALLGVALGAMLLVAAGGIYGLAGGGPRLALLFGDGSNGLSRILLSVGLVEKPLLRALGGSAAVALAFLAVVSVAGGLLCAWLLRRTPARDDLEMIE
jgi:hypothetical protein